MLGSGIDVKLIVSGSRLFGTGQARIEVLWPPSEPATPMPLSSNDSSLVARISYAGRRILLTGDISNIAQRMLLGSGIDLKADVLVWPHHGAIIDTTRSFFEAVDPEIVLVSCAADRAERIEQLDQDSLLSGRKYYSTAKNGALSVLLRAEGLQVQPFVRP